MIDTKVRCAQCGAEGLTAIMPNFMQPVCAKCYGEAIGTDYRNIRRAMKAELLRLSAKDVPALRKKAEAAAN